MEIGWRTYLVKVNMSTEFGASRSSRLFAVCHCIFHVYFMHGQTNKETNDEILFLACPPALLISSPASFTNNEMLVCMR